MKATLAELHRDTAKLVRPVIDGKKTLIITDNGEARAKIVLCPGGLTAKGIGDIAVNGRALNCHLVNESVWTDFHHSSTFNPWAFHPEPEDQNIAAQSPSAIKINSWRPSVGIFLQT